MEGTMFNTFDLNASNPNVDADLARGISTYTAPGRMIPRNHVKQVAEDYEKDKELIRKTRAIAREQATANGIVFDGYSEAETKPGCEITVMLRKSTLTAVILYNRELTMASLGVGEAEFRPRLWAVGYKIRLALAAHDPSLADVAVEFDSIFRPGEKKHLQILGLYPEDPPPKKAKAPNGKKAAPKKAAPKSKKAPKSKRAPKSKKAK